MALPVHRTSTDGANSADVTSHTVNLPSDVQAGDLLLAFVGFNGVPAVTWDDLSHGVWTPLADVVSNVDVKMVIFAKIADGTESLGSLTVTTDVAERSAFITYALFDWFGDLTNGLNVQTAVGNSANPDPPIATDSWGSVLRKTFALEVCDDARTVSSFPTSYTLHGRTANSGGGGAGVGIGSGAKDDQPGGPQDPGSWTISGVSRWAAATVSIRAAEIVGSLNEILDEAEGVSSGGVLVSGFLIDGLLNDLVLTAAGGEGQLIIIEDETLKLSVEADSDSPLLLASSTEIRLLLQAIFNLDAIEPVESVRFYHVPASGVHLMAVNVFSGETSVHTFIDSTLSRYRLILEGANGWTDDTAPQLIGIRRSITILHNQFQIVSATWLRKV